MKHINKCLLIIALMLGAWQAKAQAPPVPTVYENIGSGDHTVNDTISGSEKWLKWTGDSLVSISFKIDQDGSSLSLDTAELYLYDGSGLVLLSKDFINPADTLYSGQLDSSLYLYAGYFPVGSTLYIRMLSGASTCTSCAQAYPLITIDLKNTLYTCSPVTACDLIKNGGFENLNSGPCAGNNLAGIMQCWTGYEGTADVFTHNCTDMSNHYNLGVNIFNFPAPIGSHNGSPPNNTAVGLYSDHIGTHWNESIQSLLAAPLVPGQTYCVSFWAYNISLSNGTYNMNAPAAPCVLTISGAPNMASAPTPTSATYPSLVDPHANFSLATVNTWVQYSNTFVYTGTQNENAFLIGINQGQNIANGNDLTFYVFIDDVSLKQVSNAPPVTIPVAVCYPNSILTNLEQYMPQAGGVFAGTGIVLSGSQYNFDPSLVGNIPGVYPASYTYTTAVGCIYKVPVSINIGGNTLPVSATYSVCGSATSTLTAGGGYSAGSYTWLPGSYNGNPYSAAASSPFTYTVTAGFCTGTITTVFSGAAIPCVNTHTTGTNITVPAGTTYTLGSTGYTNTNFTCFGDLFVPPGSTASFNNCSVLMGPNTKLYISSGSTLSMRLTHMYGCTSMWQGIVLSAANGATLSATSSLIEDAKWGIYVPAAGSTGTPNINSYVTVESCVFNTNAVDIYYVNSNTNIISIKKTAFTSRCLSWDPPSSPLPSMTGTGAYYNSYLSGAAFVQPLNDNTTGINSPVLSPYIGVLMEEYANSPGTGSQIIFFDINIFDKHQVGVKTLNFDGLTLQKQLFVNGMPKSPDNISSIGNAGIYITTSNKAGYTGLVSVGGGSTLKNTFANLDYGIYATRDQKSELRTDVGYNSFQKIAKNGIHFTGVRNNTNPLNLASNNLHDNAFSDVNNYGIYVINSGVTRTLIFNNTFTNSVAAGNTIQYKGIYLGEVSNPKTARYYVYNNTISDVLKGVRAENTRFATVYSNKISLTTATAGLFPVIGSGIQLINCMQPNLWNNSVQGSGSGSSYGPDEGLETSDCGNGAYSCNTFKDTYAGSNHLGQNIGTMLYKNTYNNHQVAINLAQAGFIDVQDDPNNPGQPADNQFLNIGSGQYHTYAVTSGALATQGNFSPFYIRNVTNYQMIANGADSGPPNSVPITINTVSSPNPISGVCNQTTGSQYRTTGNTDSITTLPGLFDSTAIRPNYTTKRQLYDMLNDSGAVLTASLSAFQSANAGNSLGRFNKVDTCIANYLAGDTAALSLAKAANGFTGGNAMVGYQRDFNALYLYYLEFDSLSAAQLSSLARLAQSCPFSDGTATWQARTLLSLFDTTVYRDSCELITFDSNTGYSKASAGEGQAIGEFNSSLMPNPNTGTFTVLLNNVAGIVYAEVYDISGQMLCENRVANSNSLRLDCRQLGSGLYLVRVYANNRFIATHRMVVDH